jgi:hypothetical protein
LPSRLARLASIILCLAMMAGTSWAAEPARKAARGDKLKHSPAPAAVDTAIDLAAAKAAFQDGLRAFNLGLWEDAIAGFQKSYRLSGDAALLFNVAQAQRQAGHPKQAIIAYKAYLRENPETPHRGLVEAKIRDLEAGPALAAPLSAEARPEGDRLAGVWENPFEPAAKTKVTPSEIPEPVKSEETAPVAAIAADSSGGEQPSVKQAAPAPVLAPATPPAPAAPLMQIGNGPASEAAAKPAATRWWLWTGIGAVVAAGVVTAVILLTRSPQRDGTCPSGFDGCLPVGK